MLDVLSNKQTHKQQFKIFHVIICCLLIEVARNLDLLGSVNLQRIFDLNEFKYKLYKVFLNVYEQ